MENRFLYCYFLMNVSKRVWLFVILIMVKFFELYEVGVNCDLFCDNRSEIFVFLVGLLFLKLFLFFGFKLWFLIFEGKLNE